MRYYPVFLDLTGRRCIVIGGGVVAERKVDGLLAAGAHVTVVSPEISGGLRRLILQPSFEHLARKYERGDLAGFAIASVATDDLLKLGPYSPLAVSLIDPPAGGCVCLCL